MKNEIRAIALHSFNSGVDQGILSLIEIAENTVNSGDKEKMSLTDFIQVMKAFGKSGLCKVTEEMIDKKLNKKE